MASPHTTALSPYVPGLGTGASDLSVVGTGLSIPWGIDAVFQYNDLTFNDRSTIDKIRITSIDGIDDADIRDVREDRPASDGEIPYDSHYGGRTMVFNGRIEAFQRDKLRDMQYALRTAFLDINEEKPLYFLTNNAATYHFIMCKKNTKLQMGEEQKNQLFFRDFQLTLRASYPAFYIFNQHFANWTPPASQAVTNLGNYTTYPLINLFGSMNTVEFHIEDPDGDIHPFKLNTGVTIGSGDFYRLDFYERSATDQDGNDVFSDVDPTSDWVGLEPGTSYITIPGGKTNVSGPGGMDITYRDAYI
jgi:phage-related protein